MSRYYLRLLLVCDCLTVFRIHDDSTPECTCSPLPTQFTVAGHLPLGGKPGGVPSHPIPPPTDSGHSGGVTADPQSPPPPNAPLCQREPCRSGFCLVMPGRVYHFAGGLPFLPLLPGKSEALPETLYYSPISGPHPRGGHPGGSGVLLRGNPSFPLPFPPIACLPALPSHL